MNHSKVAVAVNKTIGIIQMILGLAVLFLFGLCTIAYIFDEETAADVGVGFLIFCLVFDALGIWLLILSRRKIKLIAAFKKYVAAISCDPSGYIPDIAASLGTSEDVVKANLERMIQKKYFSNAFIDLNSNCIVIVAKNPADTAEQHARDTAPQSGADTVAYPSAQAPEMVTVKCKACGGINTIQKGAAGECDYCGSFIKDE